MGIDMIQLGTQQGEGGRVLQEKDLSNLSFSYHDVPTPAMSIWLMTTEVRKPILPWWNYDVSIEADVKRLKDVWSVTSAQSLFDLLYLAQFKKLFGSNLYVIFPGNIRLDGWDVISEAQKNTFQRGQDCIYHLEGAYNNKISINWVPFSHPQKIVKDPSFTDIWRLFLAARGDDVVNSLSFFSTTQYTQLPDIIKILINPTDNRSHEFSKVVDWFGVYSSPLRDDFSSFSIAYSKTQNNLGPFSELQKQFSELLEATRKILLSNPSPETVFRVLSRIVAL